jgi:hypothetical protein
VSVSVPGGVPPGGSPAVVVTFPVGTALRTLPLAPVRSAGTKTISPPSPTVIFLVHGMSDATGTPTDIGEDLVKCEGPRNTPFYSRCEWDRPSRPLRSRRGKAGSLFNLQGPGRRRHALPRPAQNRPLIDENLGITARSARAPSPIPRRSVPTIRARRRTS